MPFKSEAQRRYLWANEPEIARDWADTYGSRIEAALGGIMRLGFRRGGHHDTSSSSGSSGGPPGGGATSMGSGRDSRGSSRGPRDAPDRRGHTPARNVHQTGAVTQTPGRTIGDDRFQNYATNPININTNVAPGEIGGQGYVPPQSQFNLFDYAPFIGKKSLSGMAVRGIGNLATNLFGPKEPSWNDFTKGNPHLEKKVYDWGPTAPGDGQGQQQYPPWFDDAYAQNILEDEEELDVDTSTGDMEEWIQRFRVKDPYRQDRGTLDPQIREYISKLYT